MSLREVAGLRYDAHQSDAIILPLMSAKESPAIVTGNVEGLWQTIVSHVITSKSVHMS